MATKPETKKLLQVAIITAVLAALIKIPFGLAFIVTHFTPLLWLGEVYGWATLMIGTVALGGALGALSAERALGICRKMFRMLYRLNPASNPKEVP